MTDQCNKTLCVHVVAGQSNAAGQGGRLANGTLPGQTPTGLDLGLVEDYDGGMCYAYKQLNRSDLSVNYEQGLGPLTVRTTNNGVTYFFGVEQTLGRIPNACRTDSCKKVALLKFSVGGTNLDMWQPGNGIFEEFVAFLDQRIPEALAKSGACEVEYGNMFWIQGEGDSNAIEDRSTTYPTRFASFMSDLSATHPFVPVFNQLKGPTLSASRAFHADVINQGMINAGYITTVDNNDLTFLPQTPVDQHYDAASLFELGRRNAAAIGK